MNVLVACEFSGIVRDAFTARGHAAISVDLLPSERPGPHYQGDVEQFVASLLPGTFDLAICHPPCTFLANSGVRWLYDENGEEDLDRWWEMEQGAKFFRRLLELDIPRIAVENPVMHRYAKAIVGRGQDQIVQPWMFGHDETKATGLWLKNLPKLQPTNIVPGPYNARVHREPPGPERWKNRSRTYQGIADAMAEQWGSLA